MTATRQLPVIVISSSLRRSKKSASVPANNPRAKIVAYREAHREEGMVFRRVEDLGRVSGVGKGTMEMMRAYVEVPENSNDEGRMTNDESNSNDE